MIWESLMCLLVFENEQNGLPRCRSSQQHQPRSSPVPLNPRHASRLVAYEEHKDPSPFTPGWPLSVAINKALAILVCSPLPPLHPEVVQTHAPFIDQLLRSLINSLLPISQLYMSCSSVSLPPPPPHARTHPGTASRLPLEAGQSRSSFVTSSAPANFTQPSYDLYHLTSAPTRISFNAGNDRTSSRMDTSLASRALPSGVGSRFREPPNVSISHLRDALYSLDAKMASLMSQRELLESRLQQAVRLQSPILRLPSEILSSVFVTSVLNTNDDESVMVSTLMLVCKYWSEVAVDTPVLWSSITVSKHDSLERARRKLERSKSVPLDVTINFGPRVEHLGGITESILQAVELFKPALWRTRSLRLSVPNRPQAHAVLLKCQEDAPILESLSVRIFHCIEDDQHFHPPRSLFNGYTPRLRSCSFTSFNFGWDSAITTNLRVLKLGGFLNGSSPSVEALIDILKRCPNLEELALRNLTDVDPDGCFFPDDEIDTPKVLRLPRLTTVSFYCSGIIRTRMLLGQIAFPALETLEICYLDNITPVVHLLKTQSLTSLPLRHLRIESSFFNEFKFLEFLRRLPSIVTLELVDNEDASSNLLKGLAEPIPSRPWVCPKLEYLNLDGCTSISSAALRTFVESRPPSALMSTSSGAAAAYARSRSLGSAPFNECVTSSRPHRLRSIDVTRCHQISKEMVQWLKMYVADVRCEPAKGVWGELVMS